MIKPIVFLVIIAIEVYAALSGDAFWPRYILEGGLFAAMVATGKDGRPPMNMCGRCGRAYPGDYHECGRGQQCEIW